MGALDQLESDALREQLRVVLSESSKLVLGQSAVRFVQGPWHVQVQMHGYEVLQLLLHFRRKPSLENLRVPVDHLLDCLEGIHWSE